VQATGLLRQAQQLEDVRKTEGVKRTFELHGGSPFGAGADRDWWSGGGLAV
jgi:hypothetical protein